MRSDRDSILRGGPGHAQTNAYGCKRPGRDDPARLTAAGGAEPLCGGLASDSSRREGLGGESSSGGVDLSMPTRVLAVQEAARPRATRAAGWPVVPGFAILEELGRGVRARRISAVEYLGRRCHRNPCVASLVAAVVVLSVTVVTLSTVLAVHLARAHGAAIVVGGGETATDARTNKPIRNINHEL